jgi:predicted ABC-type ATPase
LDGNDLLLAAKQVKKTKTKGKKSRKKETDILPKASETLSEASETLSEASETLSEASETLSEAAKNVDKIDEIALKRSETAPKVNRKAAYRAKVAAVVLLKGSIKKDSIKTTESITENGLRFSIQIASNNAPLPPQSPVKRVGSAVREEFIEERYRYLVGNFKTQEEALATQKIYRKKGFKGAFILRFQDGVKQ